MVLVRAKDELRRKSIKGKNEPQMNADKRGWREAFKNGMDRSNAKNDKKMIGHEKISKFSCLRE